ncbi:hypothetical protein HK102_009176 [Quaeritorhiza haematococci]|nr:hypothetical protein HK102_009176 [Quaeritorhiza haematococci]
MSLVSKVFPELRQLFHSPLIRAPVARAGSLFDDPFFREPFGALQSLQGGRNFPAVDVKETDKSYVLEAEVPGLKRDQVDIQVVDNNTIVLSGHYESRVESGTPPTTQAEPQSTQAQGTAESSSSDVITQGESGQRAVTTAAEQPRETYWAVERQVGSFRRSFTLPQAVDPEKVSASLKDGVLTVVVPKEPSRSRSIQINEQ